MSDPSANVSTGSPSSRRYAPRFLTALPVFNEREHVEEVLEQVAGHASDVLVVDDGSTDGTGELLSKLSGITVESHGRNRGYGAALQTAFDYAIVHRYDVLVTIDCDGQHEPQRISQLVEACENADIVSGSRYLDLVEDVEQAPADRRRINQQVTAELNERLGLNLTDAFCGFKAYQVRSLAELELTETGYAMPLELWVQAAHHQMEIVEVPVPLIYLDESRSFGGELDDATTRLQHYREVVDRALARVGRADAHSAATQKSTATIREILGGCCG